MPKKSASRKNITKRRAKKSTIARNPSRASPVHTFKRTVSQNIPINQLYGWNSGGFSLNLIFALSQMTCFINGASTFTPAIPDYTDFTSLFDQYQIRGVELELYWSKNIAGESTAAYSTPMLWSVIDYDDAANMTLTQLQQYPLVRTTNMGEDGGRALRQSFRPVPRLQVPDGTGGTGYAPVLDGNVWLDVANASVGHYGVKIYLDTFGRSSNVDLGTIMVVAKVEFAFKNAR